MDLATLLGLLLAWRCWHAQQRPNDDQRETFRIPGSMREMVKRGWLGEKSGQGFYKRIKTAGGSTILQLNMQTLEYEPQPKVRFPSIGDARGFVYFDRHRVHYYGSAV